MAQNKHHIPKWKIPGIAWISHTKSDSSRSQSSSSAALSTVLSGLALFHYFSFPWCMCDGPGIIITALLFFFEASHNWPLWYHGPKTPGPHQPFLFHACKTTGIMLPTSGRSRCSLTQLAHGCWSFCMQTLMKHIPRQLLWRSLESLPFRFPSEMNSGHY